MGWECSSRAVEPPPDQKADARDRDRGLGGRARRHPPSELGGARQDLRASARCLALEGERLESSNAGLGRDSRWATTEADLGTPRAGPTALASCSGGGACSRGTEVHLGRRPPRVATMTSVRRLTVRVPGLGDDGWLSDPVERVPELEDAYGRVRPGRDHGRERGLLLRCESTGRDVPTASNARTTSRISSTFRSSESKSSRSAYGRIVSPIRTWWMLRSPMLQARGRSDRRRRIDSSASGRRHAAQLERMKAKLLIAFALGRGHRSLLDGVQRKRRTDQRTVDRGQHGVEDRVQRSDSPHVQPEPQGQRARSNQSLHARGAHRRRALYCPHGLVANRQPQRSFDARPHRYRA